MGWPPSPLLSPPGSRAMRRRRRGLPPSPDSLKRGYHGGDDPSRWKRHGSYRDAEDLAGRSVGRAHRGADAGPGRPGGGAIPDATRPDAHAPSFTDPDAGGAPHSHTLAHSNAHSDAYGNGGCFADPHPDGRPDRVAHADARRGRRRAASSTSPAAGATRFGHRQRRGTRRGPPRRSPPPHWREPGRAAGGRGPRAARLRDRLAASAIGQKPPGLSGPGALGVSTNGEMAYNRIRTS